jgi:hypothetical protein
MQRAKFTTRCHRRTRYRYRLEVIELTQVRRIVMLLAPRRLEPRTSKAVAFPGQPSLLQVCTYLLSRYFAGTFHNSELWGSAGVPRIRRTLRCRKLPFSTRSSSKHESRIHLMIFENPTAVGRQNLRPYPGPLRRHYFVEVCIKPETSYENGFDQFLTSTKVSLAVTVRFCFRCRRCV